MACAESAVRTVSPCAAWKLVSPRSELCGASHLARCVCVRVYAHTQARLQHTTCPKRPARPACFVHRAADGPLWDVRAQNGVSSDDGERHQWCLHCVSDEQSICAARKLTSGMGPRTPARGTHGRMIGEGAACAVWGRSVMEKASFQIRIALSRESQR